RQPNMRNSVLPSLSLLTSYCLSPICGLLNLRALNVHRTDYQQFGARSGRGLCASDRRDESAVFDRDVGLNLVKCDLGFELAALASALDRKRQIPAVHFFVVAQRRFGLDLSAADHALGLDLDGYVVIRVHEKESNFAV